jgi:hypothetical protein
VAERHRVRFMFVPRGHPRNEDGSFDFRARLQTIYGRPHGEPPVEVVWSDDEMYGWISRAAFTRAVAGHNGGRHLRAVPS